MKRIISTGLALVSWPALADPVNTTPDWKSYQQTGNPADIVSSPIVADAIGTKVDAVDGQSLGQTITTPMITSGTAIGTDTSAAVATPAGSTTSRKNADKFAEILSVLDFGAKCDDSTDDTAAFNGALTAAASSEGGSAVKLPRGLSCKINGTVTVPSHVTLLGDGRASSIIDATGNTGTVVRLGNQLAAIRNLRIAYNTQATSGTAIDASTNTPYMAQIMDVMVSNPWLAIDVTGNSIDIARARINEAAYGGIRIGNGSTNGGTVDVRVTDTTIANYIPTSVFGMQILDSGGLYLSGNDIIGSKYGTYIHPGANQFIQWTFAVNTVLGDTAYVHGMLIDTADSTALIRSNQFVGSWTSSAAQHGVAITNTANGTIEGLSFIGHRSNTNGANGFNADGGNMTGIRLMSGSLCGNNSGGTAVYIGSGVSQYSISGNEIENRCGGNSSNSGTGIRVVAGASSGHITDNNLEGISTPILLDSAPSQYGNIVVSGNIPVADNTTSASATSGTLPLLGAYAGYTVTTDGTDVSNLTYAWTGRRVILFSTSAINYVTGGTNGSAMCNALSVPANKPVEAAYYGCWYLH